MNALLFSNLFPSAREPTRGLFNLYRFRALAEFCAVKVVVPTSFWRRFDSPRDSQQLPELRGLSATYPTYWTIPRVCMQWHAAAMYRSVRSHVSDIRRQFPFDVVLGAFAYPDVVAASRLARDAGCPLVALVMGSDMNEVAQRPHLRGQIRDALRGASQVVAVSRALKERVLELGISADRVIVQHNGVDGDRFRIRNQSEARRELGVPVSEKLVCFVGNLVHEKGPDVLTEAMGHLRSAGSSDLRVAFIGEGAQKQALLSRCTALGIGERVSFIGRRSPDEVALWLSASDVLCLPSRREGCPNVVLEALASGRPVVAAAVGGVPELLSEATGAMVVPDEPEALARALSDTLRRTWNPEELRASVPALTWEDVGHTLHDVLSEAVCSRRAR